MLMHGALKIDVVVITCHYNEILMHYEKSMWVETGNLIINYRVKI